MTRPIWLHASPQKIEVGELLLSPAERGVNPRSWGPSLQRVIDMKQYRSDRVYFWDSRGVSAETFVNYFQFTMGDVYIYEARPLGRVEPDPDPSGGNLIYDFSCAPRARILRCLWEPTTPND